MQIYDLGFAAYLIVEKNLQLTEPPSYDGQRYIFIFDISKKQFDKFHLEYIRSKFYTFDRVLKHLKRQINTAIRNYQRSENGSPNVADK